MSFLNRDDDAITVAPQLHRVIFEDDKVRVLEVTVPAGASANIHWHPRNINYVLSPGTLQFTKPDGTVSEVELAPGQVTNASESSHAVENVGDSEVRTVQIEFKDE